MSRFKQLFIVAMLCALLAPVGAIVAAESASADVAYQVYNTSGDGLWLHPTDPVIHTAVSDLMPDGTMFDINCWSYGDDVNGDSVWDFGTNESTGNTGYAADFYIDTPVHQGQEGPELTALGIPECGAAGGYAAGPAFDPQAAVGWALAHGADVQPFPDGCAWFVSKALWAGGLAKTATWTDAGGYGAWWDRRPGTITANTVDNLRAYLLSTYPGSSWQEVTSDMSPEINAIPQAYPGDLLFYSWNGSSTQFDHVAMIVGDAPGTEYPNISEWGNVDEWYWGPHLAGPQTVGWTYSSLHHNWVQSVWPNTRVFLLQLNTTHVSSY